ncbi:MAG TPA: MarR family transcriptional regulator [Aggregatilineales bacterium]|nr:MarR family transcriptional regulator [Aggregatilineales bacterium]
MIRRVVGAEVDPSALELARNIGIADHIMTALSERHLGGQMTFAQFRMLSWLYMQDEENKTGLLPSQLSRFQGVTPNTVSSLLHSLRKQGFIEQVSHPEDRRKRIIKITEAGRELVREMTPRQFRYVSGLLDGLDPEERQTLIQLTGKLIATVKARAKDCEAASAASALQSPLAARRPPR